MRLFSKRPAPAPRPAKYGVSAARAPFGSDVNDDGTTYRTTTIGIDVYKKMRETDTTVAFASEFLAQGVVRRIGDFFSDNVEIRDFVNANVMPAVRAAAKSMLDGLYFGVSVSEIVYQAIEGGRMGVGFIHTIDPEEFWHGAITISQQTGEVQRVGLSKSGGTQNLEAFNHGVRRLAVYSHRAPYNNVWGTPLARLAYPAWFIKSTLIKWEARGLEQNGLPIAIFKAPTVASGSETAEDPGQALVNDWTKLGAASAMAINTQDELDKVIKIIESSFQGGSPFSETIRRLDEYIYQAFMQPSLLSSSAQFGSYNLAGVQMQTYLLAEEALATDFIERVIMAQIVRPAIRINFGVAASTDREARVEVVDGRPVDDARFAQILTQLYTVGIFQPDDPAMARWVQDMLGVPIEDALAAGKLKPPVQQPGSAPASLSAGVI